VRLGEGRSEGDGALGLAVRALHEGGLSRLQVAAPQRGGQPRVRFREALVALEGGAERLLGLHVVCVHVPPLEVGLALQVRLERLGVARGDTRPRSANAQRVHELRGEGLVLAEHLVHRGLHADGADLDPVAPPPAQLRLHPLVAHADRPAHHRVDTELAGHRLGILRGIEGVARAEGHDLDARIRAQAVAHALGHEVLEPRALGRALVGEGEEGDAEPRLGHDRGRRPEEAGHDPDDDGDDDDARHDGRLAAAGLAHRPRDRGGGRGGHERRAERGRGVREGLLELGRRGEADGGVPLQAAEHQRVEGGRHLGNEVAGGRAALARLAEGEGERSSVPRRPAAGQHLVEDDA
jgi:hypothetical protein